MPGSTPDRLIRTRRLQLVAVTPPFVAAVIAGDVSGAGTLIGGKVGLWLTTDPSHLIQLNLAAQAAEARNYPGLGRLILLPRSGEAGRVVGSIGFHGPPDDRGRLEASCRIHPAYRGRGLAAEALTGLLDWATERYGVRRFLVAIPSHGDGREPVPVEVEAARPGRRDAATGRLSDLLESKRRAP